MVFKPSQIMEIACGDPVESVTHPNSMIKDKGLEIANDTTLSTMAIIPDGSCFANSEVDTTMAWGPDWSLDWLSSDLAFPQSNILDHALRDQNTEWDHFPLDGKIDFFEGLENVGGGSTTSTLTGGTEARILVAATLEESSPYLGTELSITSTLERDIDITGKPFSLGYL